MDLVVAGHAFAPGRIDQAGVEHMAVVSGLQRQRAGHHPQLQLPGSPGHEVLDRPLAKNLPVGQLVGVPGSHGTEILGQHHQLRTQGGSLLHQAARLHQIGCDVLTRDHL
ncbi:hypothetical protein SDC9_177172 [bioreactor metagenome]|uniref:Uncharacterized protein n=1 Tax=bioreactor metagenome TaxID=1076179 RepID=A0A645GVE4_9ZZZZ